MKQIIILSLVIKSLLSGTGIDIQLNEDREGYFINLGEKFFLFSNNILPICESNETNFKKLKKEELGKEYYDNNIQINLVEKEIPINDKKLNLKYIWFSHPKPNYYYNKLGLGFEINPYKFKYSFINQLYEKNLISKRIFSIDYNNNKINFGSESNIKTFGKCSIIKEIKDWNNKLSNPNWQCEIKGFFTGKNKEKLIEIEKRFSFLTLLSFHSHHIMNIPFSLYNQLKDNYFKDLINEGKCNATERFEKLVFLCDSKIDLKDDIYFSFGNWGLKIPKNKILYEQEIGCLDTCFYVSVFQYDLKDGDLNKNLMVMPINFMKDYLISYDYDNKEVGFYSNDNIIKINVEKVKKSSFFYIYICFAIFVILIGFYFSKYRKQIKMENDIELKFII